MDRSSLVDGFQLMKEGWNVPMNHVLRLLKSALMVKMVAEAKRIMSLQPHAEQALEEEKEDEFLMEAVLDHEQSIAARGEHNLVRQSLSGPMITSTPSGTSTNVRKRSLPLSSPSPPNSERGNVSGGAYLESGASIKGAKLGRKDFPAQQQRLQTPTTFPLPGGKAAASASRSSSRASSSNGSGSSRSEAGVRKQKKTPGQTRVKQGHPTAVVGKIKNPLLRHTIPSSRVDSDPGEVCSDFTE